ncbi:MAG: DUF1553 domain-containing protein [Pirellulales bacterium]
MNRWAITSIFLITASCLPLGISAAETVEFARDVKPILAQYCYDCHGPDENRRDTDLRLDQRNGLFEKLAEGKQLITPLQSHSSELYLRLISSDSDERMPPESLQRRPSLSEIAVIKRWIDEGAIWNQHWSLTPIEQPATPKVTATNWMDNSIDPFVMSQLELNNQQPSVRANKATLLRRVTYDLTGLPPTMAELDDFLADDSANAYLKVVDRLLASPRFGEHQARFWLDAARYADTHGYNIDSHRDMWRYREVVINALNNNMPFDQFTIEQLAGDMLPDATIDQITASGFNRNHPINDEMGALEDEYRNVYVVDRVTTTSTVWLGLTMSCAQCHDHKYDAISQKEFYSLYAIFNNITDRGLDGKWGNAIPFTSSPTSLQQQELAKNKKQIQEVELALRDKIRVKANNFGNSKSEIELLGKSKDVPPTDYQFSLPLNEQQGNQTVLNRGDGKQQAIDIHLAKNKPAIWIKRKNDNSLLFDGLTSVAIESLTQFNSRQPLSFSLWLYPTTDDSATLISADGSKGSLRLDLDDESLQFKLETSDSLAAIHVQSRTKLEKFAWTHLAVTYDGSGQAKGLKVFLNGEESLLNYLQDNLTNKISFGKKVLIGKDFRGMLDEVQYFSRALLSSEIQIIQNQNAIAEILAISPAKRSAAQNEKIASFLLQQTDPEYRQLQSELEVLNRNLRNLNYRSPQTMVMQERNQARESFLLTRGQYDKPIHPVSPGVPSMLPQIKSEGPMNRLAFAKWLVHRQNPLTARVIVNRYWQQYFGVGLVKTVGDFGVRGELPSHPQLLDHIAARFIDSGWDVKALHRLIVLSATYQQSSEVSRKAYLADPENRRLSRGPRIRLAAEEIRDSALLASRLLGNEIGGQSVKPYQPADLWREVSYGREFSSQYYKQDHGARLYRRSLYTYWKRSSPPPNLAAFNAPNREDCTVRRGRTNTPLQAFVVMNDPTFVEAARNLAQLITIEHPESIELQLQTAFRHLASRLPTQEELEILSNMYQQQLQEYRLAPEEATKLLSVGELPYSRQLPEIEFASLSFICQMIMNLDESLSTN